jgi:MoxR-like ATPase
MYPQADHGDGSLNAPPPGANASGPPVPGSMAPADTAPLARVQEEMARIIVGQQRMLDRLLCGLVAGGHVLLEGAPGVGKTLTLASLSRAMGGSFARIQCTPDLLPSDIVGTRVYRASTESFSLEPGPVFANFVLVDEINRAPAKVQSALLEVMAEQQVTLGGTTLAAPQPFMVLATQNPLESEGVFPLPEAQRDRFMMRVLVPLPSAAEERAILDRVRVANPVASQVSTPEELLELRARSIAVEVPEPVIDYMVRLTMATRDPVGAGLGDMASQIAYGVSPRATIALDRGARAMAIIRGRDHATCQDVYDVAFDVLNHRVGVTFDAEADGIDAAAVCHSVLRRVWAPEGW